MFRHLINGIHCVCSALFARVVVGFAVLFRGMRHSQIGILCFANTIAHSGNWRHVLMASGSQICGGFEDRRCRSSIVPLLSYKSHNNVQPIKTVRRSGSECSKVKTLLSSCTIPVYMIARPSGKARVIQTSEILGNTDCYQRWIQMVPTITTGISSSSPSLLLPVLCLYIVCCCTGLTKEDESQSACTSIQPQMTSSLSLGIGQKWPTKA